LGLDDDLSDQFDQPHRDGNDSDAYNNARRKKVRNLLGKYTNDRNEKMKIQMSMHFQALKTVKRNERKMYLS
jgi:hypothetical protein